jgi:hypothetical protein
VRRLALALAALTAFPLTPAVAAPKPTVTTWVVERTSPAKHPVTVRGGAGAPKHEWVMAAVASATVGRDGRFQSADGGVFFGATSESGAVVKSPAGDVRCDGLPNGGTSCTDDGLAGSGIAFAIFWDDPAFNRVLVTIRGVGASIDLGDKGSPGWRLRRWTGTTRIVTSDMASADGPLGAGGAAFGDAQAPGGPGGSVAVGHPPCKGFGYAAAGSGAVRLLGGTKEAVATCPADLFPPAAAATGGTEWTFTGASAGVSDVPARLVVFDLPVRRG